MREGGRGTLGPWRLGPPPATGFPRAFTAPRGPVRRAADAPGARNRYCTEPAGSRTVLRMRIITVSGTSSFTPCAPYITHVV
ncbi:hypothetical protein GCM10023082_24530 [Streptomyces tremellae]|uniref:Uncharacterized protein n=1 Tax=Streptomyces tremellae TaxID=1124239 RepID=A0ABP7EWH5_9ACTN